MQVSLEFHSGEPTEVGWYIGAVNYDPENPNYLVTVMLWFNPSSWGKWWYGCGLGGCKGIDYEKSEALNGNWGDKYARVVYWAKLPELSTLNKAQNIK